MSTGESRGAYGFRITGVGSLSRRFGCVPADWPELRLETGPPYPGPAEPPGTTDVGEDSAILWLPDGNRITLRRQAATVRFEMASVPRAEMIVHPLLGLPAAVMSLWRGRLALHGGAFVTDTGAWALLGGRSSGKSTSLAQMLSLGHAILSDDMLVLEGGEVFRGPRSIDLRAQPAARLGGEEMGIMGSRTRWRLDPGEAPAVVPLRGFVELEWASKVSIRPLDASERLPLLYENSAIFPRPSEAEALLEILGLPAWRFSRPQDLDQSLSALGQLLSVLGG